MAEGLLQPGGQVWAVDPTDAPAVLQAAVELGFRQLWIGPTAGRLLHLGPSFAIPQGLTFKAGIPHPWVRDAIANGWTPSTDPPGLSPWVGLSKPAGAVDVVIPGWDDSNPFRGAASAQVLLRALQLYSSALGVRYRRSPSATGLALMHHVHDVKGGVRIPEAHLAPPALQVSDSQGEGSWLSARPIEEGSWVHGWDINGMYLAACSDAWLGYGTPQHDLAPRNVLASDPGHYRATITPREDSATWPLPIRADGKPRWYTPPALRLAVDLGAEVELEEAWTYPERGRWLAPWYEVLRDGRTALAGKSTPEARLALGALKATYTRSLGRLAGQWLQEGDSTFRPDWRETIVARARANFHRHLLRVWNAGAGEAPLGIHADAVLYLSPHADPSAAARALGLEVSPQLGKWKHSGRLAGAAARQLVAGQRTPQKRLRALLDGLGAE